MRQSKLGHHQSYSVDCDNHGKFFVAYSASLDIYGERGTFPVPIVDDPVITILDGARIQITSAVHVSASAPISAKGTIGGPVYVGENRGEEEEAVRACAAAAVTDMLTATT